MKASPSPVLLSKGGKQKERLSSTASLFGKYEKIPVNRISNRLAEGTLTDTSLPAQASSPAGFMHSFMKHGYTRISSGAHGEVFSVSNVSGIKELFSALQNRIVYKSPASIPMGTQVIVKVISIPDYDLWSSDRRTIEMQYLANTTKRTIMRNLKVNSVPSSLLRQHIPAVTKNFMTRTEATRQSYIDRFLKTCQQEAWDEVLREGATDATNHVHLVKSPPEVIHTPRGTLTLSARDVVPDFYFSGSLVRYGVYVVVMGVARGKTVDSLLRRKSEKRAKFSPELVVVIEKALLTLAIAGVEHGDFHLGNIMVDDKKDTIKVIDFGMTSILPERFRLKATKATTRAVTTLFQTGSWPEKNTNDVWYDPMEGTIRYLNSYMMEKHGKNFSWYNPSGKLLLAAKSETQKKALDKARCNLWTSLLAKSFSPSGFKRPRAMDYDAPLYLKKKSIMLNYGNL